MTLVVLGIDALDPNIVDPDDHPCLSLAATKAIATIDSHVGEPSTHELWPTIITGLRPEDHGLTLADDGVAWGNPVLDLGSSVADVMLPDSLQRRIGAWLLTNTQTDAFRTPATYYADNGIETVFDGRRAKPIGIPNYATGSEDREHRLRRELGSLFERDVDATGGHTTSDPAVFYERCMEMAMVRIARVRRALRGGGYELVFGYTSGLDLIGHVAHDRPNLQERAYGELDEFVGELEGDLTTGDELLLVSDHGLQDGVHTHEAMASSTAPELVSDIESVTDVRAAIEAALESAKHEPDAPPDTEATGLTPGSEAVREQLEDLGYMD